VRRGVRGAARRSIGLVATTPQTLMGISGFAASSAFYRTPAASEGPPGGNTFTCWAIVWDVKTSAVNQCIFARGSAFGGVSGWRLIQQSASIRFVANDGTGAVQSPPYTVGAADANALTVFHGVIDVPGGRVKLYRNGVEIGAPGTAINASFVPQAVQASVGVLSGGGSPFISGDICGCGAVDVALTAGQVASHYAAIVAAGRSVLPGFGTSTWNYHSGDAGATWPYTGTGPNGNMTRTGTLTYTPRPLVWSV